MEFLIDNLIPIMAIFGAFGVAYVVNIILGVFNNCVRDGETFNFKRCFISLLEVVVVGIVVLATNAAFNLIQFGAELYGWDISDEVLSVANIGLFIALFGKGFAQCVLDVRNKINALFEINVDKDGPADIVIPVGAENPAVCMAQNEPSENDAPYCLRYDPELEPAAIEGAQKRYEEFGGGTYGVG